MKIKYKLTMESDIEYLETYVFPLGRSRSRSELDSKEGALVRMNTSECMAIIRACLSVASETNGIWEFTILLEGPPGYWIGDLEPGSNEFTMVLIGPPDIRKDSYVLEVPENPGPLVVHWLPGSKIKVESKQDYFDIIGTAPAFVSLAHHFASLASKAYPPGTKIRYEPGRDLDPVSIPLVIEKADFPMDVPWAKLPPTKKT